ncbi:MAG: hypothetical protein D9V47_14540 [Clostridia bacterium]|nr:MAG: hypothetical protein D9V47_14540 [Clostridia bacterium]
MRCPDLGKLMAYLDGELAPDAADGLAEHLAACARCRARLATLTAEQQAISRALLPFQQASQHLPVRAPAPGRLLNPSPPQGGSQTMSKYWKTVAAVAAAALVLGLYPPARSLAGQFLSVFRVEKVEVQHIDPADVEELQQGT